MKCKHIDECKQKVSKEIFELFCLKGKLGDLRWHQDDCFKYNDISFVEMDGKLKLPKEWKEILEKRMTEDSPENYHTFLTSHKIFETPFVPHDRGEFPLSLLSHPQKHKE